jgi:hypothetical protein
VNVRARALVVVAFCAVTAVAPARAQGVAGDGFEYHSNDFNYASVCVFAELVSGYVLPPVNARLLRDPRLHRKPTVPGMAGLGSAYIFTGDGVTGVLWWDKRGIGHDAICVLPWDKCVASYFAEFQVAPQRIPAMWRSRGALMSLIGARWQPGTSSGFVVGCENWSVSFSFVGEALKSIRFQDLRSSYD